MFYLFPFGRVATADGIIIYGAGEVGQSFVRQLNVLNLFPIIYMADKKIASPQTIENIRYVPAEEVGSLPKYPIVVASVKFGDEISQSLVSQGISQDRIVTIDSSYALQESLVEPHSYNWNEYYNNAEGHNEVHFHTYLEPLMNKYHFDFSNVLDFACGKGRIAELLSTSSGSLTCVDTNDEAIAYCSERFAEKDNVVCKVSEPESIPIESGSMSFIYSWDAMVHFDYRSIDYILTEFSRVLKSGGQAVIHHSNAKGHSSFEADKNWRKNPHWRSEFNAQDMAHICQKSGFIIEEQLVIDWGVKSLDCISVIKKR